MTVTYRLDPFTAAYAITIGEAIIGHAYEEKFARQFAAASDLLAVAEIFARYLADNGGDEQFHNSDGRGWLTITRAALAKATGKSK